MGIGKYVTNLGIWSALAGSIGLARKHKRGPADWRRFVPWLVWLLGVIVAVADVKFEADAAAAAANSADSAADGAAAGDGKKRSGRAGRKGGRSGARRGVGAA